MTGLEAIGAASGLASLFNTTITWFDYILVAKQAGPRLQSLYVQLDAAQLRLTRWGQAAGLTGTEISDEDSMKNSASFQLEDDQEVQAIKTFVAVADLFKEFQKLCHGERSESDPIGKDTEISPFKAAGPDWNPMHRYLHEKMRKITASRTNSAQVPPVERLKFAIYKKKHLEDFITKINNHIDDLYKTYTPPAKEQAALSKAELVELLKVVTELSSASERDPLIHTAVQSIIDNKGSETNFTINGSKFMKAGQDANGTYAMTINEKK